MEKLENWLAVRKLEVGQFSKQEKLGNGKIGKWTCPKTRKVG